MADVFISYAREDRDFVARLADALTTRGRDSWVDWERIEPSDDWMQSIRDAIDAADTFLFILSPDSINSRVCALEIEYASAQNKRLIAVVARDIEGLAVPAAVAQVNWIFLRAGDDFAAGVTELERALDLDVDIVRLHTRVLTRARAWELAGRRVSPLLRGEELRAAEAWLTRAAGGVQPQPTELQQAFIVASRHAARRRQRVVVGIASAVAVVSLTLAVLALVSRSTAIANEHSAQSRELAAEATVQFQAGALDEAALLAIEAWRMAPTDEARGALIEGIESTPGMLGYITDPNSVNPAVAFSPDGTTVVWGSEQLDAATLVSIDAPNRTRTFTKGYTGAGTNLAFSPDGRLLAIGSDNGTVGIWDTATGRELQELTLPGFSVLGSVALSPDDRTLAVGLDPEPLPSPQFSTAAVAVWDLASGHLVRTLRAPGDSTGFASVAFSPDGRLLAAGSQDGSTDLWSVSSGAMLRSLSGASGAVNAVAFAPNGMTLATADEDHTVVIWSPTSGQRLRTLRGHSAAVTSVAFSPDGGTLVSGSEDQTAIVWDSATGARLRTLRGHDAAVADVAFSNDGDSIQIGYADGTAIVWAAGDENTGVLDQSNVSDSVAFTDRGDTVFSANYPTQIESWDAASGRLLQTLKDAFSGQLAVDPTDRLLANATANNVDVWSLLTGKLRYSETPTPGTSSSATVGVAFSPDGSILATGTSEPSVVLWRASTGQRLRTIAASGDALAFSPNGKLLAAGGENWEIQLRDPRSGRLIRVLKGHLGPVEAVAFSPDGKLLASGSEDRTVILWNPATGTEIDVLRGPTDAITSLAFNRDGSILAAASEDGSVTLWDPATGDQLGVPSREHSGPVWGVAFSADGSTLASGGSDQTVDLLGPFPARDNASATIDRLCAVVRRNLTRADWTRFLPGVQYGRTCPEWPSG